MGNKIRTSAPGRKCAFPRCKQVLSIYNHSPYCHIHREKMERKQAMQTPYHHPA
ncbi:MAG: hypothetical protein JXM79_22690 [Sedimentisphaerales bacterium]|nr:hypothetical protein [Sedimentisphaerales bacterium]